MPLLLMPPLPRVLQRLHRGLTQALRCAHTISAFHNRAYTHTLPFAEEQGSAYHIHTVTCWNLHLRCFLARSCRGILSGAPHKDHRARIWMGSTRTTACKLLLCLHVTLFSAVLWTVVSPFFYALLQHLHLPQLPVVTMPFGAFFRGAGAPSQHEAPPFYPRRPQEFFAPPPRALWLERIVANSKIPDAPKMFSVKDKTVRRLDPSTSTAWFS